MVERVAKAMFATDWPKDDWSRFKPGDAATNRYMAMAKSALQELRKPEPEMLDEGPPYPYMDDEVWAKIIDAAL